MLFAVFRMNKKKTQGDIEKEYYFSFLQRVQQIKYI